jgi:hypothetical protein
LNNNGPQLSNVGLMIEEQLGGGFTAIPKLETEFKTEIPARRRYFAICSGVYQFASSGSSPSGSAAPMPFVQAFGDDLMESLSSPAPVWRVSC